MKLRTLLLAPVLAFSTLSLSFAQSPEKTADIDVAKVGEKAPDFSVLSEKGVEINMTNNAGKVFVLEWTNFSCPFVKKHYSSKNMQALQEKYTAEGVVWLTVLSSAPGKQGFFDTEGFTKAAAELGSKATALVSDPKGELGRSFDAKVTPHMMIISKDRILAYSGAIDSVSSTDAADVAKATPLFANALDAVLAGKKVENAKNKPYGCGVKY